MRYWFGCCFVGYAAVVARATSPLVETVVPPRVELPRTFTDPRGLRGALDCLLFGAMVYGFMAIGPWPAPLRWGDLVCMSVGALIAWFSLGTRRIICTKQGITVSTRSLLTGLRQSVCPWSDVTATTHTYNPACLGEGTFAVETSQGTAVTIIDTRLAPSAFKEFVAICNAQTPQLPCIWEHRQRPLPRHHMRVGGVSMACGPQDEMSQPDFFKVRRAPPAPGTMPAPRTRHPKSLA
jgi:hypothetical protein